MTAPVLLVVPSDPIGDYEAAGYGSWLEPYYNPCAMFGAVVAVSPLEPAARTAHGMRIVPCGWFRFADAAARVRPDVIRAYGGYWPAELVCSSVPRRAPVVVSLHDNVEALASPLIRFADRVLCVSETVRDLAKRRGCEADRIRLLPNRVDLDVFRRRSGPAVDALRTRFGEGRCILHVGRKTHQKNIETLVRALVHLPDDVFAVFVGRGDDTPYRRLAEACGVARRCHWIERVPSDELPVWYSWCRCMCTPSRHEGFGIVFIEAAACGAPIVTSNVGPMNEFLADGESAVLVDGFEDPGALAGALDKVLSDDSLRGRIAAGAVRAAARFDRHVIEAMERGFYEEAMALPVRSLTGREERLVRRQAAQSAMKLFVRRHIRLVARAPVDFEGVP